ncbi:hypothetical protein [Euzebya sp.]|uniref:hypothetical protein n=1 Tax=Euzebya sp. TaxID=1971409 RepID=UPI0035178364
MPPSTPRLLLDIAARIEFDPSFAAHVAADPLVALTAEGIDAATAMSLLDDGDVTAFAGGVERIAVRAYELAMRVLRAGG